MQTLAQIRELLAQRGLSPRKALGQNFLIDHNLIRKLADAANLAPGDVVLEVGPGTGTLTEELLARGCRIIACELDRGLAELLRERFADAIAASLLDLIEGDMLASKRSLAPVAVEHLRRAGPAFKLVANLPYSAGTPVILALLIDHPQCRSLHVTIQREVADRLLAGPGSRDFGPLAVVAQALTRIERIATLPPECFWPRPEVTSTMLSLHRLSHPRTADPRRLADFCQRVFSRRRKQLGAILGRRGGQPAAGAGEHANLEPSGLWPPGISPQNRIEELSVDQIIALAEKVG